MKLLFLDDERMRHDWADEYYRDFEVHHAYTFEQFQKALLRTKFDVVSFDHDIADRPPRDPNKTRLENKRAEVTGLTCADWMIARPDLHPTQFCVVHSWNPVGAQRLVQTLERHFRVVRRLAGNDTDGCTIFDEVNGEKR